jgi:hypothetical protein
MNLRRMLFALLLASSLAVGADEPPLFSTLTPGQTIPASFRVITLPKVAKNTFSIVADEGKTVLRVESADSAGSIGIPLSAAGGTVANSTLNWRWKVDRVLDNADLSEKRGDDFAARVYVFFDVPLQSLSFFDRTKITLARIITGSNVPTAALCYIWDNTHDIGHTAWSAYTTRVRMIVLQSGPRRVGQWVSESRNVAADFRAAFGFEAPVVTGVAIGNDTDNTHERVTTWYGDISLGMPTAPATPSP